MKRGNVILVVLVGAALLLVLRPRHLPSGDKITMAEFDSQARAPGLLITDFFATWCGPCIEMHPYIEEARSNYAGRVRFLSIDIDQNPELTARFSVEGFPTLMVFKDGKPILAHPGFMDRDTLNRWIKEVAVPEGMKLPAPEAQHTTP